MEVVNFKNQTKVITFRGKTFIECDFTEFATIDWKKNAVVLMKPKYCKLSAKFIRQAELVAAYYNLQVLNK